MRQRSIGSATLFAVLLGAIAIAPVGCRDRDSADEAVEEMQDEMRDAGNAIQRKADEAKEEIEDEVDDHTTD